jgi:hypothetical protein
VTTSMNWPKALVIVIVVAVAVQLVAIALWALGVFTLTPHSKRDGAGARPRVESLR